MVNQKRDSESLFALFQGEVAKETAYLKVLLMYIGVPNEISLKIFKWSGGDNSTNIHTGFLPLIVTPPGATIVKATNRQDDNQEIWMDYTIVHKENGNKLTLTETRGICNNKAFIPNN